MCLVFLAAIAALYVVMSVRPSVRPSVREQRVSRSVPKFKDVITGLFGSLVVEFSS